MVNVNGREFAQDDSKGSDSSYFLWSADLNCVKKFESVIFFLLVEGNLSISGDFAAFSVLVFTTQTCHQKQIEFDETRGKEEYLWMSDRGNE
jgi:hypothetical protein